MEIPDVPDVILSPPELAARHAELDAEDLHQIIEALGQQLETTCQAFIGILVARGVRLSDEEWDQLQKVLGPTLIAAVLPESRRYLTKLVPSLS